jgi:hypothetical protein
MLIRDRIRELRRVPAGQLRPHPRNWRTHPPQQRDALRGVLAEIGYADALLARELPDGSLQLIDGHLRAETTPECLVPVLVVDVSDAEAEKLLAVLDPLASAAGRDAEKLRDLLADVQTDNAALQALWQQMAGDAAFSSDEPADPLASQKPPGLQIAPEYQLLVTCRDEAQQQALYEQLTDAGYACRVLTL